MILYAVLLSAFGAVVMYFLLKELTGDWKSGFVGGFLFATLPMLLTKSAAGATEEDPMGMVLGIFSIYLLIRAIKTEGNTSIKYAVLSAISFFITTITWGGSNFLFIAPFFAIAIYLYLGSIFNRENWNITKAVFIAGLLFVIFRLLYLGGNFLLDLEFIAPMGAAFMTGLWAEGVKEKISGSSALKLIRTGALLVGFVALVLLYWSLFVEALPDNARSEFAIGVLLLLAGMLVASIIAIIAPSKGNKKLLGDIKPAELIESLRRNALIISTIVLVLAIVALLSTSLMAKLSNISISTYERFAGVSNQNFLVDKTISEQGALASGSLAERLQKGLASYGAGELLTILMGIAVIPLLGYYFFTKKGEQMSSLLLAYLVGLVFFSFTMRFVWVEARLGFSQSLGFIMLGATAGLLLPKNLKEIGTIKILPLVIIIPLLLMFTFFPSVLTQSGIDSAWDSAKRPASVDPAWFNGVKWLDANIAPGAFVGDNYVSGDYVFTWWDYGHFITALSRATVITDPLQADESYIMRTARFFYNKTTEDEAIAWLMTQPWSSNSSGEYKTKYIILDYSLVGKASALAFLGTNYYQYPNGYEAVNGVCQSGEICQNVENGLLADYTDGKYSCKQGVVCTRDKMISAIDEKKCCEEAPTQCCDPSYDWRVIDEKGGFPKILRSPGTPVYGQYELVDPGYYLPNCRKEYTTSTDPIFVVENGERKTVTTRFLYSGFSGLAYGDGGDYPALIIFTYADGTQNLKFISRTCDTKEYSEVMGLGKDLLKNLGYGQRLSEDVIAPQIFVHVPQKWLNSMFTKLYLLDGKNPDGTSLKYIHMIDNEQMQKIYPSVKIYTIDFPNEIPVINPNGAKWGDTLEVDYTGRFENGTVFDSSVGRAPLRFILGVDGMIDGFEEAVMGMEVNESKTVTIPPEKAYGVGTGHPLANKTLIFDIRLVSINAQASPEVPEPIPEVEPPVGNETAGNYILNMTFDYYNAELNSAYTANRFPLLVWGCQYKRFGMVGDDLDALRKLTCIMTKGEPLDVCGAAGIVFQNGKVAAGNEEEQKYLRALSSSLFKTDMEPCALPGSMTLQAFYSKSCSQCALQKSALDTIASEFGDYLDISYYCAGDDTYCREHSANVIA